jgi:hypothetical protein
MKREAYVVFVGQVDESGYGFNEISNPDSTELLKERYYKQKLFKFARIGGIYKVDFEPKPDDPSKEFIQFNPKQMPVALFKDINQIVKWKATTEGFVGLDKINKITQGNKMATQLAPIREAYREASPQSRKLILAEVIRLITSY